jgi:hypothetical protein
VRQQVVSSYPRLRVDLANDHSKITIDNETYTSFSSTAKNFLQRRRR